MRSGLRPRMVRVLLGTLALMLPAAAGEPVIIAHPESGVRTLSRDEVVNIFMGRQKRLPSGLPVLPVEQAEPAAIRSRFYLLLVGKNLPDVNAYWARLLYSGQAQPPRQVQSAAEVLELVAQNKGALGMVDAAFVDRRVRVVFEPARASPQ